MRNVPIVLLLACATAAGSPALASMKGAALASQAKVSLAKARRTALAVRPGKVTDEELEKEKGGSGLRYSFDITSMGKKYEVGIDAKTGAVLENGVETKAD
jgi:uncharacterized membrane protein YkoI